MNESSQQVAADEEQLSTVTIVLIVLGVIVVPLTLIAFGKYLERRFRYQPGEKSSSVAPSHRMFDSRKPQR
jgi:hypothetical protein